LASFLQYAQTPLPKVWQALSDALADEKHRQTLVDAALATPLGDLASFLQSAQTLMSKVWQALSDALAEEKHRQRLVAAALTTPLEHLASFLQYAQTPMPKVWLALTDALSDEKHRQVLVDTALATSLGHLASFLQCAQTPMPKVWLALSDALADEKNRQTLVNAALATPLGHLASFLQYTQTPMPQVWLALSDALADEKNRQTLVNAALATPLEHLASFLQYAQTPMPQVWLALTDALASHADRLSQNGKTATTNALVGFAHHAPISLFEVALREIRPGHWSSTPVSKGLVGAIWLARRCENAKRDDLTADLVALLLRRANWRDFPSQSGGYAQVCWLLANIPDSAAALVEPFLKAVRTDKWLQIAYVATGSGPLASGLRQLALHQSVERCRQFHHKGLGGRLNKELAVFERASPEEQSQIIQFLGCAGLCGWAVSQRSLAGISLGPASQLPVSVLPHRLSAANVEDHQLQLWLGLRLFVSITRERLPLSRAIIEETLRLWRVNLGETASTPATTAHRVNQSMVAWLESCARANPPALVPSSEPLWVLAGFPFRLNSIKQGFVDRTQAPQEEE
ncbi:MAG: hypothetical protein K1X78_22435, partial [Verrucomicrobiaceae bacterium]|nr:hypothetical protein [Verrucomicrobiaceae bacterium]